MTTTGMLSLTRRVLFALILVNGLLGLGIAVLLVLSGLAAPWTFGALGIPPDAAVAHRVALRTIVGLGLLSIPLNHCVLASLLRVVESSRAADPFIPANAHRLRDIGWALLLLQALSLAIGAVAGTIPTHDVSMNLDAGFSTGGWLAVLLAFALAGVFGAGARMREDLRGTV